MQNYFGGQTQEGGGVFGSNVLGEKVFSKAPNLTTTEIK